MARLVPVLRSRPQTIDARQGTHRFAGSRAAGGATAIGDGRTVVRWHGGRWSVVTARAARQMADGRRRAAGLRSSGAGGAGAQRAEHLVYSAELPTHAPRSGHQRHSAHEYRTVISQPLPPLPSISGAQLDQAEAFGDLGVSSNRVHYAYPLQSSTRWSLVVLVIAGSGRGQKEMSERQNGVQCVFAGFVPSCLRLILALDLPALARPTSTLPRGSCWRWAIGRRASALQAHSRSSAKHPQSRPSAIPRSRRRDLHLLPCLFFLCCVRRVPCPVPPYSPRSSALFAAQSPLEARSDHH